MHDLVDEHVMTSFLLGTLEADDKERIADRLAHDIGYFEAMEALDDDLILRWHRGDLSGEQQQLFKHAYLSAPARRARVDESRALLDAAQAWNARPRASLWTRIVAWLVAPSRAPRFAFVAAGALLAAAISLSGYVARSTTRGANDAEQQVAALRQSPTSPRVVWLVRCRRSSNEDQVPGGAWTASGSRPTSTRYSYWWRCPAEWSANPSPSNSSRWTAAPWRHPRSCASIPRSPQR
jgi:hypothetical protein